MSQSSQGGMALALGVAFAMLVMSALAPLGWWSPAPAPTDDPAPTPVEFAEPVDPFAVTRRDESKVLSEPLPTVVDGWDELQMLAAEPMLSDFEPLVASKAEMPRSSAVRSLPTWEPAPTSAPSGIRLARRAPSVAPAVAIQPSLNDPAAPAMQQINRQRREPDQSRATWVTPSQLVEQLKSLDAPGAQEYVTAVTAWLQYIEQLEPSESLAPSFEALRYIHAKAPAIAAKLSPQDRRRMLIANYALQRRLGVWELTEQIGDPAVQVSTAPLPMDTVSDLRASISRVRSWLNDGDQSQGWTAFLLLRELEDRATVNDPALRSQLAQRLLGRLEGLTNPVHQRFLSNDHVNSLLTAVRYWAADVSWDGDLVKTLELAEQGDFEASRKVACLAKSLQWSRDPRHQQVGKHLELHYRNANIRVSFQEEFLNRWVDDPDPTTQPFRDSIMGAEVSGSNHIETEMAVDLAPHPSAWQFLVQAGGVVRSKSTTEKGPATVFSSGLAYYVAEKDLWLTTDGPTSSPARAATDLSTYLDGFNTKFDGVPVLGGLTRTMVRHQHDKQQSKATAIARQKSNSRISREMDLEVEKQLDKATAEVEESVFKPLRRLKLQAVAMDMSTTDDRATARGRLAGRGQLAAFTPRPIPPSQAMADVQVHQSAMNNFLAGLELDGKRATIAEIGQHIARKFEKEWKPDEDTPKRTLETIIAFAETQPVSVVADNDELRIHLRLTELDAGGNDFWYDFDVEAVYEPVVEGAQLKFVRTKPLSIDGEEFGFRDVIALRGIFAKMFDREEALVLIGEDIAKRKAMQGLEITQCVITNGWLGLAIDRPTSPVAAAPSQPRWNNGRDSGAAPVVHLTP